MWTILIKTEGGGIDPIGPFSEKKVAEDWLEKNGYTDEHSYWKKGVKQAQVRKMIPPETVS